MFSFNVLLDIREINAKLIAEIAHPVVRFLDRIIICILKSYQQGTDPTPRG